MLAQHYKQNFVVLVFNNIKAGVYLIPGYTDQYTFYWVSVKEQ